MTLVSPRRLAAMFALALAPLARGGSQQSAAPPALPLVNIYTFNAGAAAVPAIDGTPLVDLGVSGTAAETFNRVVTVRRQSSGNLIVAKSDCRWMPSRSSSGEWRTLSSRATRTIM